MQNDRRLGYKLPPVVRRESSLPQEARRIKALEGQKRRRAEQIESNRQFDLFSHLTLNDDSDSDDPPEEAGPSSGHVPSTSAVGPYVAMLNEQASDSHTHGGSGVHNILATLEPMDQSLDGSGALPTTTTSPPQKKKSKKRNKKKGNYNKPSKWADQCMYAELLEMATDEKQWSMDGSEEDDPLPKDLETGWVAVAPVPVVANTTVRSRLLGKSLIPRFPSPLPPMTVLDCILDANWRENGIIHVLDVVKWKGQDIGDCEAPFRFWWRDTRLGEMPMALPPTINFFSKSSKIEHETQDEHAKHPQFPYPTYFLPIPYHTNTSLLSLETLVIPLARERRSVVVEVPISKEIPANTSVMDLGSGVPPSSAFTFINTISPSIVMSPSPVVIEPDGLLLYTSEACYEPGTSPLSNWVPIEGYNAPADVISNTKMPIPRPLDLFQRLIQRRLQRRQLEASNSGGRDVFMDMEPIV